jgi:D-alanyl-D-alanine carboxypeptidase (penicillin-binding protein 5/6)
MVAFVLAVSLLATIASAASLDSILTARAAIVVNATTGRVLYQKNPDLRLPQASTTKVTTALVALEQGKLNKYLRVSAHAAQIPPVKIGLHRNQKMTVEALLYGMLLYSANDASTVVAEGLGGSVANFADMMNRRVRALGAYNTHFVNSNGLPAPGHYSTARDLAKIYSAAMRDPKFQQIVQTKLATVELLTAGKRPRLRPIKFRNRNRLLWDFDGALGGKTGYTREARRCFVGAATRNGHTLVVAILGAQVHHLWPETEALFNYGFANATLEKYLVQVASLMSKQQANLLSLQITATGYRAYVEGFSFHDGRTMYRVRVGPYQERLFADQAAHELRRRTGLDTFVLFVGKDS